MLAELRSAEVPIPYLLFSQTKTTGRFQSFAYQNTHPSTHERKINNIKKNSATPAYHVVRLEHLALVTRTITIHRKRRIRQLQILLRERQSRAQRDLRANDTVSSRTRVSDMFRLEVAVDATLPHRYCSGW